MTARFLPALLAVAVLWSCGGDGALEDSPEPVTARDPGRSDLDVLLITVDTLRADALGAYGNRESQTPWMDRLVAHGVRFDNAHAHGVVTLPTHASILTGLLPQQHGVRDNSGFRLREDLPTLATLLREQGYRTGAFVSAFPLDSRFGLDRGFEVYEDRLGSNAGRALLTELERSGVETVALAREWIASKPGEPWFCWVHLYEPHFPYGPPDSTGAGTVETLYLSDVAAADAALQPLLEPLLEDQGADVLIVLTSDHGESLGEHGEATHGIFAYQSTLRVPLILHQPSLLAPRVLTDPVAQVDLLPTILEALAIPAPSGLAGTSLLRLAQGDGAVASAPVYFEALSGQLNRGWAPLYGVLDGSLKFIDLPVPELYDLAVDPGETANLAAERPRQVAELRRTLGELRATDEGALREIEDAETLRRLESLGYLTGAAEPRSVYTEADDPKNLIELDQAMRDVGSLHAQGDLDAAVAAAREITQRRPGMRLALLQLAQLERQAGNLPAAIEALEEAYRLLPSDPTTLAQWGAALTQADRAAATVAITESLSDGESPDVDVLLVRALAQARTGDPLGATRTLDLATQIDPGNPLVEVHRGTLSLLSGDRAAARTAFTRALELDPETVAALTALGILELEDGRSAQGVDLWRQAVTLDPQQLPRLLAYASYLWNQGNHAAARPLMKLFLEEAPPEAYPQEISRLRQLLDVAG